ncbi:DUF2953 domain-containing protein [Kaarinaea lacus]
MILIAILLGVIIAILAIPFEFRFNIQRRESFHSEVAVRWLFGIVTFDVLRPQKPRGKNQQHTRAAKKKTKKKRKNIGNAKELIWNAKFRQRLIRFVKDIFNSVHISAFNLRLQLGLDDPADTGRLWAFMGPLSIWLSKLSNTKVQLQPDFQNELVYLNTNGTVRIIPLAIIGNVLAFLLSPITINAITTMRRAH